MNQPQQPPNPWANPPQNSPQQPPQGPPPNSPQAPPPQWGQQPTQQFPPQQGGGPQQPWNPQQQNQPQQPWNPQQQFPPQQPQNAPHGAQWNPAQRNPMQSPPQQPSTARRPNRKLLIGIVAGVLVIALGIGGVALKGHLDQRAAERAAAEAAAAHEAEKQAQTTKAQESVQTFLTAISKGSAKDALGQLTAKPEDATLLTDGALAQAKKAGGLSDPQVTSIEMAEDFSTATAETSFQVGRKKGTWSYDLEAKEGRWLISNGTAKTGFTVEGGGTVTVNGVKVTSGDKLPAFPGTYQVSTGSDRVGLSSTSVVVSGERASSWSAERELTSAGRAFVIKAGKASFEKCAKSDDPEPSGCTASLDVKANNGTVSKGSVKRTISGDPFKSPAISMNSSGTSARGAIVFKISVKARGKLKGGGSGTLTISKQTRYATFSVSDLTGKGTVGWN